MALFETPGIQGELVWNDSFASNVASYPPECLPSNFTNYFSSFAWSPATQPYQPVVGLGGSLFGMGVVAGRFPLGNVVGSSVRFQTKHIHIFAQVAYRINEPMVLTQEMIISKQVQLPEHIFEMVAATDKPIPLPVWIKPVYDYTINISKMSDSNVFTIQFGLVFDTPVEWKIDSVTTTFQGDTSAIITINETCLLGIKPVLLDTGTT